MNRTPADYISLNIEPLFNLIKSRTQVWARLPLGVWGRINIVKMILLPKILYILWHTPVYLPLKLFKSMEAILRTFIWGTNRHKLAWRVLKNPTDLGGTALPDLNLYYLASQLSQLYHIDKTDRLRFLTLLCPQWAQLTTDPLTAVAVGHRGGGSGGGRGSLLYQYRRIWDIAAKILGTPTHNDYTPLWHNKILPEFISIPNTNIWSEHGIYYLHHLFSNGTLKNFERLQNEFLLPNSLLFQFLQVHHAVQAQFTQPLPQSSPNVVMAIVKGEDPRRLISDFYVMLLTPSSTVLAYNLRPRWEREVGLLEDEEWSEALDACKTVSPKLSDRLTQLYVVHRAYLTPLRIARFRQQSSTSCTMCNQATGTFFHLLWACSVLQGLWKQIVDCLHDGTGSPLSLDSKQCLLGIFPDA